MEQLDLRRHSPDEIVGKSLTLGARNYTIGARFKDGADAHAYFLVNELSGLCLHVLRIQKEYLSNPARALAASRDKARETATLRSNMLRNAQEVTIPFVSVIEGNGGCFELHQIKWGAFGHTEDSPGRESVDSAVSLSGAGDLRAAATVLMALLESHPNHAIALGLLAGVVCELNDQPSARQMFARAIEIEPNYSKLQGQQIVVALRATRRREALELFDELKSRYPSLGDYDGLGINAYLICGEAQQALDLLQQNTLPPSDAETLQAQITTALEVKQVLANISEAVGNAPLDEAELREVLEALYKAYPGDPQVQANLGSALYRAGQFQRAVELLLAAGGGIADGFVVYIWVNLAFALMKILKWEMAMQLLSDTMDEVARRSAQDATLRPSDVPGLVDWFSDDGALKSRQHSSYEILMAAMAECPDQRLITPQVRQLADLYRQAAGVPAAHATVGAA